MSNNEKCCGTCNDHRKCISEFGSEWQCRNSESEFYKEEREYHDTCSKWNKDGPYITTPIYL